MMMTRHVGVEIAEHDLFEVHHTYTTCFFAIISFSFLIFSSEYYTSRDLIFIAVDISYHHMTIPTNNSAARCH